MLAYQQTDSTALVAFIMEITILTRQQHVAEFIRPMLTQSLTAGQYFTIGEIQELPCKVGAEVQLVQKQTHHQRYRSCHYGAPAKDNSHFVNYAATCVV